MTNALASEPKRPRPILRIFAVLVAVAAMSDLELCGTTRAGYTILSFVHQYIQMSIAFHEMAI